MPYNVKYNQDLIQINKLIDENKINEQDEALEKFKQHIEEIQHIGRFSVEIWNSDWRNTVYNFGTKFKNIDPIDFLKVITSAKQNIDKDKQEVLDFYYSEIDANSLPEETCSKRMEAFVTKYPYNPEFRHTFGHFFKNRKEYEKSIEQYKFALKKDKKNETFITSLFGSYYEYFESFIDKSEYEKGLKICINLLEEKIFQDNFVYQNYLISIKERFKDYILLNQKILNAEIKIEKIISKEIISGQHRIIEILGFFTAIIAFIFSTITIGKNFNFNDAIIFNISLGITLIIFVLLVSLLFSKKQVKLLDYRIILILLMIISLLLIILKFGFSVLQ